MRVSSGGRKYAATASGGAVPSALVAARVPEKVADQRTHERRDDQRAARPLASPLFAAHDHHGAHDRRRGR